MEKAKNPKSRKKIIFCNNCKNDTIHICQSEYLRHREYEDCYWEENRYRLYICAGCEQATMENSFRDVGFGDDNNWEYSYFPKREVYDIIRKSFRKLPKKLSAIYLEVIKAYNNGLNLLCSVGLRALIEGICDEKK